jgi:predicted LPLAT superfamily acyltransferase/glycosyltransferase involved in cell wall biosynthesis
MKKRHDWVYRVSECLRHPARFDNLASPARNGLVEPEPAQRSCELAQACVVVPVFNNARTVGDVVRGALEHVSTVIVFDDGSTDGSSEKAQAAGASVLRRQTNTGKGTALRRLFEAAHERGFLYAISLDADGQHVPADLPRFLEVAVKDPGALILGARDLVASGAPGSSEFGRRASNFWIWFETGLRLADSQSGFRGYPLPETLQLKPWGTRYEFEADVLLRAAWAGIPIRTVPVHVLYPADRITHFRLVVDNIRIVALNTVACLRMALPLRLGPRLKQLPHRPGLSLFALRRWAWLGGEGPGWRAAAAAAGIVSSLDSVDPWLRVLTGLGCVLAGLGALPALIAATSWSALVHQGVRPALAAALVLGVFALLGGLEAIRSPRETRGKQWTGQSRGGVFGHWFFFQVTRRFGVSAAYLILYPVAFYFLCTWRSARNASLQFLERAVGPASLPMRLGRTYRHFLAFARTMVDRALFATRGKGVFRYEENGIDHIRSAAASGRGAILLTAHIGNWEVAAGLLGEAGKKLAIVAYRGDHERLTRYMDRAQGPRPRIIEVGNSESFSSLEMLRSLREGAVLALQGDRPIDHHVVRVPFLGQEASFPVGPFVLAAVSGAPLIATFSLQVAPVTYRFFAQPPVQLSFRRDESRDGQLRTWVQQYVLQLEALVRQHPYQWFNFYDFWGAAAPSLVSKAPALGAAGRGAPELDAGRPPPTADPDRPVAPMH